MGEVGDKKEEVTRTCEVRWDGYDDEIGCSGKYDLCCGCNVGLGLFANTQHGWCAP